MSYDDRNELRRGVRDALAKPLADVVEELYYDYRVSGAETELQAVINELIRQVHLGVEGEFRRRRGE